jgi:3-dehydroquinate synthase
VAITAQAKQYPIVIGQGALATVGSLVAQHLPKTQQVLIVSDPTVAPLYLQAVCQRLEAQGLVVGTVITPVAGEGAKTLAVAQAVYQQAHHMGLSRQDAIVALGGGVVGDLAGFCAATYFRGTQFVQLPTTVLAQVDSSVGGKVAVNFENSKNGIGAFYQPNLVLIDPDTLSTLAPREIKAGLAEVLKYALLQHTISPDWPDDFLETLATFSPQRPADYSPIIETCCRLKALVVAADETESKGVRALLNLGHTFAHAYEAITNYAVFLHGEAVALGMDHACQFAVEQGLLPVAQYQRYQAVAQHLGLVGYPSLATQAGVSATALVDLMLHDKKASHGQLTLVLPQNTLGHVVLTQAYSADAMRSFLSRVIR